MNPQSAADMSRTIYGLFYFEPDSLPVKRYFYVGRSIDVLRREKQHRYAKKKGHEDKYEFIRSLESRGLSWFTESLREIPENEYPPDNERWFVIKLTREGHMLMNMRHGSVEHRKKLAEQIKCPSIRSISDVRADRREYAGSRKLRRNILEGALQTVGIPDISKDKLLPTVLRRRLIARNCLRIEKGVTLSEIIQLDRAEPMFRHLREQISR